jgi:tagatose-6-phosphate ketose/aldose isomerase
MLANSFCSNIYHLIITCNPTGNLANSMKGDNVYLFVLPPAANDQALAMTGSYTSMLLAGVLFARINELDELKSQVNNLSGFGDNILRNHVRSLQEIAKINFKRAVFLGSGPLYGSAHESHLKLQELTDGNVICKFDSFLGIRHGPKAVINKDTLMVYLLSNSSYVRRYEIDLLNEISREGKALISLGICQTVHPDYKVDQLMEVSPEQIEIDEEFLAICAVLPSQILGYYKSIQLGLNPDQPSASGAISRVVSGVGIYNYNEH